MGRVNGLLANVIRYGLKYFGVIDHPCWLHTLYQLFWVYERQSHMRYQRF